MAESKLRVSIDWEKWRANPRRARLVALVGEKADGLFAEAWSFALENGSPDLHFMLPRWLWESGGFGDELLKVGLAGEHSRPNGAPIDIRGAEEVKFILLLGDQGIGPEPVAATGGATFHMIPWFILAYFADSARRLIIDITGQLIGMLGRRIPIGIGWTFGAPFRAQYKPLLELGEHFREVNLSISYEAKLSELKAWNKLREKGWNVFQVVAGVRYVKQHGLAALCVVYLLEHGREVLARLHAAQISEAPALEREHRLRAEAELQRAHVIFQHRLKAWQAEIPELERSKKIDELRHEQPERFNVEPGSTAELLIALQLWKSSEERREELARGGQVLPFPADRVRRAGEG